MLNRLYQTLATLTRRQENILLLIAGAAGALALPPVHLIPVLFAIIPLWLLLLEKAPTAKRAFWMGWLFGFGYFIAGLYWIAAALFVDIARYWWVLPFAVAGLPFLMAFYWGLAAVAWHFLPWRGWPKILAFAVIFTLCEYLRGVLFTGFPWNYVGYVWTIFLPMLQSTALFGVVGLTFITILLSCLPYSYVTRQHGHYRQRHLFSAVVLACVIGLVAWGCGRLSNPPSVMQKTPLIRIVQPNIAQEAKWSPEQQAKHRETLWRLSRTKEGGLAPNMIVWPETAIALIDTLDVRVWQSELNAKLPFGGLLAAGTLEADLVGDDGEPSFFNRLTVFNRDGDPVATYSKSHLVPFGEYLPLQKYWPVTPPAVTAGAFTAGHGPETLTINEFPSFSALVCYEVIFPDDVVDQKNRPSFLLNVTNDGWYGRTSGPYQHLAITQTRAVEQGLPMVRAANTGISAMIDGQGRLIATLGLGEEGRIETPLPQTLPPTVFARYGQQTWLLLLGLCFVVAFLGQSAQQKRLKSA